MSKKMNQTFKITALASALLAAYGPALAEGPHNSVSIGAGNWSSDRPHEGQYDGMRDGRAYGVLDFDISKRDAAAGTWFGLKARNLGLDTHEIKGEWQRQGEIGASLEYSRIRRDQPYTYNTNVTGIGTTTQLVPATLATGATAGTGTNVELGTIRDRISANFFKNLGPGFKFDVTFKNEEKNGTRPWGRGGAAEFAVEPINSTTRQLEASLSYARERLQLSGGYYGTTYDNANSLVTTSLTTGASVYYLSLPMDNRSHQLFLNGGYDFTKTTRGMFKVSYTRATQDEALPSISGATTTTMTSPLAPTNLNGRVDTTLINFGLSSKPMPKLSVVADWRYRNYADKTPDVMDIFNAGNGGLESTAPLSYISNTGKLEATYRLPQSYSLLGGIDYNKQKNGVQGFNAIVPFRPDWTEMTYRLQLRKSMSETLNGSLGYLQSKRTGSNYALPGDPQEDAINPWNMADRKRDKWRATADWSPTNRLALQLVLEDGHDRYSGKEGPYGLQESIFRMWTLDASYHLTQNWQVRGWYSREQARARETTQQNATNTKYNDLAGEASHSLGLNLFGKLSEKLKLGGNVEWFRSLTRTGQDSNTALATNVVEPPDVNNRLLRVKLFAQYAVQKNADLQFNLIRELWQTDDWTWMMLTPTGAVPFVYGSTTDGTSVIQAPKQNSTFAGVRYIIRFQ